MAKTRKRKAPSEHAKEFALGHRKIGNDGEMWRITETKNGVKRWSQVSGKTLKKRKKKKTKKRVKRRSPVSGKTLKKGKLNEKDLFEKLYSSIHPWWSKLSEGEIIIIFKDKSYKFCKSNKKTSVAKAKDLRRKWREYGHDMNVVGIIWSSMSVDTLQHFVNYLLFAVPEEQLGKMGKMKKKDLQRYIIRNYKKYFHKYEMVTKKDLMFKQRTKSKILF